MSEKLNQLLADFDAAIKKKAKGKFSKEDVETIYKSAHQLFDGYIQLTPKEVDQIREKWVTLA